MPTNSALANIRTTALDPVLGIAARMLTDARDDAVAASWADDVDRDAAVEALVGTARLNAHQLKLLIDLVDVVACAATVVIEIYDHARAFDACDPGAVGAAASLLELTVLGDERQMGEHLAASLDAFDVTELLFGAAALTAAFSTTIADWLELDADEVHDEIVGVIGTDDRSPRHRGRCTRPLGRAGNAGSVWAGVAGLPR